MVNEGQSCLPKAMAPFQPKARPVYRRQVLLIEGLSCLPKPSSTYHSRLCLTKDNPAYRRPFQYTESLSCLLKACPAYLYNYVYRPRKVHSRTNVVLQPMPPLSSRSTSVPDQSVPVPKTVSDRCAAEWALRRPSFRWEPYNRLETWRYNCLEMRRYGSEWYARNDGI